MKKGVLVVFAALMSAAMLATPVLAAPNDKAWHTVPAGLATNQSVTYAELTEACLNDWGLSVNPYPAPLTPSQEIIGGHLLIHNGAAYYIFTLQIGGDVYEGVSCNVLEIDLNLATKHLVYQSEAIWYLGKWGKQNAEMESGIAGDIVLVMEGFVRDPVTGEESYDSLTGTFNLEGFGCFNHHTFVMYVDSINPANEFGSCTFLGNQHKM